MKDAIELRSCQHVYIHFVPLMPDEDRNSGTWPALKFWIPEVFGVTSIYTKLSRLIFIGLNSGPLNFLLTHGLPL